MGVAGLSFFSRMTLLGSFLWSPIPLQPVMWISQFYRPTNTRPNTTPLQAFAGQAHGPGSPLPSLSNHPFIFVIFSLCLPLAHMVTLRWCLCHTHQSSRPTWFQIWWVCIKSYNGSSKIWYFVYYVSWWHLCGFSATSACSGPFHALFYTNKGSFKICCIVNKTSAQSFKTKIP